MFIMANGVTTLKFNEYDIFPGLIPPWSKPQRLMETDEMPSFLEQSPLEKLRMVFDVAMWKADNGGMAGVDSLYAFFQNGPNTGVSGKRDSFLLTDTSRSISWQVRFISDIGGGFTEELYDTNFTGRFVLEAYRILPTDLDSLKFWGTGYDMDDDGGQLTGWTTLDDIGDTGKEWDDKSGNSNDATEATASQRPHWTTSMLNGRPAADFDAAANQQLVIPNIEADFDGAPNAISFAAVVQADTVTGDRPIFAVCDTGGGGHYRIIGISADKIWFKQNGATTNKAALSAAAAITISTAFILVVVVTAAQAVSAWVNGSRVINATDVSGSGNFTLDEAHLGSSYAGATDQWDGPIAETVVCQSAWTTRERKRQERRLSHMSSISLDR